MIVEVEVFGQLAPQLPRRQSITLAGPVTVGEAMQLLGLDPEKVGLITMDGIQCEEEEQVTPGCRLCFFAHLSGG